MLMLLMSNNSIIFRIKRKTRDKLNNLVMFDKPTYDKPLKKVPTYN